MQQLEEGGPDPLVFVLNANLLAMVKLVNCELPTFHWPLTGLDCRDTSRFRSITWFKEK